jgi:nucleotide-binding universal stress UspA family protein
MYRSLAVEDFKQARQKANLEKILARFLKRETDLLSYEEVRSKLKATEGSKRELKEIPLDSIIGSVGRYTDFSRRFLPKFDEDMDRWTRVYTAMTQDPGLPPIEVYQVGDVFFVLDGHHRVSIARQMDAPSIEAYVRQVTTKVPLSPGDQPNDLIIKAEYADFLVRTQLDQLRPDSNLLVTKPGQYDAIEEQISVHRHFMRTKAEREITYEQAVVQWYDEIFFPVIEIIRERGILRDFPGRTETDLFLWISKYRKELEKSLEWKIDTEAAAEELVDAFSPVPSKTASRLSKKLLDKVTPDSLESGPPPGEWRREQTESRRRDCLFYDVLVPISGEQEGWYALEQAFHIVRQEGGHLRGLHVVPSDKHKTGGRVKGVQNEFQLRCQHAGLVGSLVVEVGNITRTICERSRWNDLIVMNLSHPPSEKPIAKLGSGFRTLIRRCPVPILALKDNPSLMSNALLAYDGSPKATEGLFIATYVASSWKTSLVIMAVDEKGEDTNLILQQASTHLNRRGVTAKFIHKSGNLPEAILQTAQDESSDWIIMGGYGMKPLVEVALGSAVDQVLRESEKPVLICR